MMDAANKVCAFLNDCLNNPAYRTDLEVLMEFNPDYPELRPLTLLNGILSACGQQQVQRVVEDGKTISFQAV